MTIYDDVEPVPRHSFVANVAAAVLAAVAVLRRLRDGRFSGDVAAIVLLAVPWSFVRSRTLDDISGMIAVSSTTAFILLFPMLVVSVIAAHAAAGVVARHAIVVLPLSIIAPIAGIGADAGIPVGAVLTIFAASGALLGAGWRLGADAPLRPSV